jgi:DNA-binding response OmpR family regulator
MLRNNKRWQQRCKGTLGYQLHIMSPRNRRSPAESLVVIVIEDDADARHIYSEYLRRQGWTVFTAPDGRVGLNKIDELKPDVIVLDLAMPRVDGWTVLKHVRESSLTSKIAVVVVSAMSDARDQAFTAGCDAYLMKPCPPDVVYLQIRALSRFQAAARSSRSFV